MTLLGVGRFLVAARVVVATDEALREAGAEGNERFVLWTGVREGSDFVVRTTHVPAQTAYRMDGGLCVRVGGEALDRLNRWQYEHGETLSVQVHSHPKDAYHSDTDDAFPIVTTVGGVSLVVPNFDRDGLRGRGVATYRLVEDGWDELDDDEARALVVLGA